MVDAEEVDVAAAVAFDAVALEVVVSGGGSLGRLAAAGV